MARFNENNMHWGGDNKIHDGCSPIAKVEGAGDPGFGMRANVWATFHPTEAAR